MNHQQTETLEEIRETLASLRANPHSRRKFPVEIWKSIVRLTHIYPFSQICEQLDIHPVYLKRKMKQLEEVSASNVDFTEIPSLASVIPTDSVIIELTSPSGLKAQIQGSSVCLNILSTLFKG